MGASAALESLVRLMPSHAHRLRTDQRRKTRGSLAASLFVRPPYLSFPPDPRPRSPQRSRASEPKVVESVLVAKHGEKRVRGVQLWFLRDRRGLKAMVRRPDRNGCRNRVFMAVAAISAAGACPPSRNVCHFNGLIV
jgi:hypothetical protein